MRKIPATRRAIRQRISQERSEYERARRREWLLVLHGDVPARRRTQPRKVSRSGRYIPPSAQTIVVTVPETVDLVQHLADTVAIARSCRSACLAQGKKVFLDFSATKHVSSGAKLYLVAELDRCRRVAGHPSVNGNFPDSRHARRSMRDSGFYDMLDVDAGVTEKERTYPVEYIKVMTGNEADGGLAKKLRQMLLGPYAADIDVEARQSFFRGISEAMTNVAQHAYPDSYDYGPIKISPRRWWLLGHVEKKSGLLRIMIVDQGIGIPKSLPRTYPMEVINGWLNYLPLFTPDDGQMIKAAMKKGRSSTELRNRGKGLNDLKEIIDVCGSGQLSILSNRGRYRYSVTRGVPHEQAEQLAANIRGTFIEWAVPLSAVVPKLGEVP